MRAWQRPALALVFLLVAVTSRSVVAEGLPRLDTDSARVGYLLHLRQLFPQLFQDAARHETDLLRVLEAQQAFEQRMATDAALMPLVVPRRALVTVNITPQESGGTQVTRIISPEAIARWRQELFSAVPGGSGSGTGTVAERLEGAIRTEMAVLQNNSPQHFLNGLLSTVPQDRFPDGGRAAIFRMPLSGQLQFLRGNLPENLTQGGFRAGTFTLPPGDLMRTAAISRLETLARHEATLTRLVQAHLLLQGADGTLGDPTRLLQIGEGDLDVFFDRATFRQRNGRLAAALQVTPQALLRVVENPVGAGARRLQQETIQVTVRMSGPLRLVELPPQGGIFRGAVGGDCATSHSALYANAPNERVFLIYDANGNARGYVAMTHVVANGEPALYVHTINGKNVSQSDAETIFQALHQNREALGARRILLTPNVGGNMNYGTIQRAFTEASHNRPLVDMTYPDAAFREKIAETQISIYDRPSSNPRAYEYAPPARARRIAVTIGVPPPVAYTPGPVSRQEALLFALDLERVGSRTNASRVLRIPELNMSRADFERLVAAFDNHDHRPMREFYRRIRRMLRDIANIHVDRAFFDSRSYLFQVGHLSSAEFREPNRITTLRPIRQRRTLDFVIDELRNEESPRESLAILSRNLEWFAAQPRFQAMVKKLLGGDSPDVVTAPPDAVDLQIAQRIFTAGLPVEHFLPELRRLFPLLGHANYDVAQAVETLLSSVRHWTEADITAMAALIDNAEAAYRARRAIAKMLDRSPSLQVHFLSRAFEAGNERWREIFASMERFAPELLTEAARRIGEGRHAEIGRIVPLFQSRREDAQFLVVPLVEYLRSHADSPEAAPTIESLRQFPQARLQLSLFSPEHRVVGDALLADLASPQAAVVSRAVKTIWTLQNRDQPLMTALIEIALDGARPQALRTLALSAVEQSTLRSADYVTRIAAWLRLAAATPADVVIAMRLAKTLGSHASPAVQAEVLAHWERAPVNGEIWRLATELLTREGPMPRDTMLRIAAKLATGNETVLTAVAAILNAHPSTDPSLGPLVARALGRQEAGASQDVLRQVLHGTGLRDTATHDVLVGYLEHESSSLRDIARKLLAASPNLSTQNQLLYARGLFATAGDFNGHWGRDAIPQLRWETTSPEYLAAVLAHLARRTEPFRTVAIDVLSRGCVASVEVQRRLVEIAADDTVSPPQRARALRALAPTQNHGESVPMPQFDAAVIRSLLALARAGDPDTATIIRSEVLAAQPRVAAAELVAILNDMIANPQGIHPRWELVERSASADPAVLAALGRLFSLPGFRDQSSFELLKTIPEIPLPSLRDFHQRVLAGTTDSHTLRQRLGWFDERAPGDAELQRQRAAVLQNPETTAEIKRAILELVPAAGTIAPELSQAIYDLTGPTVPTELRATALEKIQRSGRHDAVTLARLRSLATDANDRIAELALRAVLTLPFTHDERQGALITFLEASQRYASSDAIRYFEQHGLPERTLELARRVPHFHSDHARRSVVYYLESLRPPPAGLEAIVGEWLSSTNAHTRQVGAHYFSQNPATTPSIFEALVRLATDPHIEVRRSALSALGRLPRSAVPGIPEALGANLGHADAEVRRNAEYAATTHGAPLPVLLGRLDAATEARELASLLASLRPTPIFDTPTIERIGRLIGHSDASVRLQAAGIIDSAPQAASSTAVRILKEHVYAAETDEQLRSALVYYLGRRVPGDVSIVIHAIAHLNSPTPGVRLAAIRVISEAQGDGPGFANARLRAAESALALLATEHFRGNDAYLLLLSLSQVQAPVAERAVARARSLLTHADPPIRVGAAAVLLRAPPSAGVAGVERAQLVKSLVDLVCSVTVENNTAEGYSAAWLLTQMPTEIPEAQLARLRALLASTDMSSNFAAHYFFTNARLTDVATRDALVAALERLLATPNPHRHQVQQLHDAIALASPAENRPSRIADLLARVAGNGLVASCFAAVGLLF